MTYYKQLDVYRAIAVMLVLVTHWIAPGNFPALYYVHSHAGSMGVAAFFVLSGFLISRLLFRAKPETPVSAQAQFIVIKNFYARRFLRIFPIYYLVLACITGLAIFNIIEIVKNELIYSAVYLGNFYMMKVGYRTPYTSHFWSLAVEEQLYFVWPFLVIFFSKKLLPFFIFTMMVVGIYYNVTADTTLDFLDTRSCLDSFATGALYAWVITYYPTKTKLLFGFVSALAFMFLVALVVQISYADFGFPHRLTYDFCSLWIIMIIVENNRIANNRLFTGVFNNAALQFLGRISYGMYVYHLYLPYILAWFVKKVFNTSVPLTDTASSDAWFIAVNFCILIVVSWLSFKLIEQPILNYKKRFSEGFTTA